MADRAREMLIQKKTERRANSLSFFIKDSSFNSFLHGLMAVTWEEKRDRAPLLVNEEFSLFLWNLHEIYISSHLCLKSSLTGFTVIHLNSTSNMGWYEFTIREILYDIEIKENQVQKVLGINLGLELEMFKKSFLNKQRGRGGFRGRGVIALRPH